ncbi:MAG TPA: glycosyltransferase family 4 protein [Acidimicrobiales bacterium]|nr:glycosyltransferase family 4 protein [Acidimicrobiales bacterium]
MTKIAYVTPRYGAEIVGGAENAARKLAERLVADLGWEVEALTTCAVDNRSWANDYPEGTVEVNGVRVHRFPNAAGRDPGFDRFSRKILEQPFRAAPRDQDRWIQMQGPHSPALLDAVAASDADLLVFGPYLYEPAVRGIPAVARRAVFHPAAHDEAPIHLPIYRRVFTSARGLVFWTNTERRLVERLFAVASSPQIVLGLGVDDGEGDPAAARAALGLGDRPFLLYQGRIDDGKGTTVLAEFFAAYKRRRPGPLALVLSGPVDDRPPEHPDIMVPGMVEDSTMWGLFRGAEVYVHPSAYESFSIVLMDAWEAGRPALVNARCEVTREHCLRSGGGLWFGDYATFEVALDRLLGDAALRARLGQRGQAYVEANYRWPALIERYRRFLEQLC